MLGQFQKIWRQFFVLEAVFNFNQVLDLVNEPDVDLGNGMNFPDGDALSQGFGNSEGPLVVNLAEVFTEIIS